MRLVIKHKSSFGLVALLLLLLITGGLAVNALSVRERLARNETQATADLSQQAGPAPIQQAESTVRGRVLYADSRRPLRRADVMLIEADTGNENARVTTDRRGAFMFEHVPAGRYLIVLNAPGIVSPYDLLGRCDSLTKQIMLGVIKDGYTEVTVEGKSGSVEAEVRARRGGVITGRVTTEDGEPLAGANVKLFRRERGRLVRVASTWLIVNDERRSLQTDTRGIYRIAGLPAGDYVVRVSEDEINTDGISEMDEAYSDGSLMIAYYPSATSVKDAQSVTVVEGSESTGIDVRMPDRETRRIAGRATYGSEGVPAAYVEIKVDRKDEGALAASILDFKARADDDGKWEVKGIPDGEYVITVGDGISNSVRLPESRGWVDIAPGRLTVNVAGADVSGLDIRLGAAAGVSGRVLVEGGAASLPERLRIDVAPVASDRDAKSRTPDERRDRQSQTAASRAGMAFAPEDEGGSNGTFMREGGEFTIQSLPAGRYNLRLSGIASDRFYVKAITRNGVDLMRAPFTLNEGSSFENVRVLLATDLATVTGSVIAPATETLSSGAIVVLAPADEVSRRMIHGLLVTRTDKAGRFIIRCPPGEYLIAAFTRRQTQATAIDEDYFRKEGAKLRRITPRAGEESKALSVPVIF